MGLDPARDFDGFFRVEFPRLLALLSAADLCAADALQVAFAEAAAWDRISAYEDPAGWAGGLPGLPKPAGVPVRVTDGVVACTAR